jgi:hypothetical protein
MRRGMGAVYISCADNVHLCVCVQVQIDLQFKKTLKKIVIASKRSTRKGSFMT